MRRARALCAVGGVVFFLVSAAWAAPELTILSSETRSYKPADPASTGLKEFKILVQDYKILTQGEENFGTRAFTSFDTRKIDDLKDFGFVQFIRGCKFHSCARDGAVERSIDQVVMSFDELVPFQFKDLTIDSVDVDPLYNSPWEPSNPERLSLYRWNSVAGSFDPKTEHLLQDRAPEVASLYVVDRPGVAYYDAKLKCAYNISLEFRICLYRETDVPRSCGRQDVGFAQPIACLEWPSSFVFNHSTLKFEKSKLAPICEL